MKAIFKLKRAAKAHALREPLNYPQKPDGKSNRGHGVRKGYIKGFVPYNVQ